MNTRKWLITSGTVILAALAMLALAVGLTQAQGPGPERDPNTPSEVDAAASVSALIPIQGRLTDNTGSPLNGTYNLTFRFYEQSTGGTALCSDSDAVSVDDGLFEFTLGYCWDYLHGQQVWLAVEVESDGEMTPRQRIYPVPYALSLRPGAVISDNQSGEIMRIRNNGSGQGIIINTQDNYGLSASNSGSDDAAISGYNGTTGTGVEGMSLAGIGVYGGSLGGVGVEASSGVSIALKASGTGIIQSSADTEIAVSPLKMVPQNNSSDIEFLVDGAYVEVRPVALGIESVYVPVDLPSVLFGTDTKLKSIRVCYKVDQATSFIDTTFVRYGTDSGTLSTLITNNDDRTNTSWDCYTVTDSTPGEISGSVYVQFSLSYAGTGSAHDIRIGSITLTLTEE